MTETEKDKEIKRLKLKNKYQVRKYNSLMKAHIAVLKHNVHQQDIITKQDTYHDILRKIILESSDIAYKKDFDGNIEI